MVGPFGSTRYHSAMSLSDQLLHRLRAQVVEIEPGEALPLQATGAWLLDVREAAELAAGRVPGARHVPRSMLELQIEGVVPQLHQPLLLLCAAGSRSLLAAASLSQLGYTDVRSIRGGFNAWRERGLPLEHSSDLSAGERAQYARQLILPEVGELGQLRLKSARVLLVGAGGLGSPAALYLAAAGVGRLTLLDSDRVEASNLHRQVLHRHTGIGLAKVVSARQSLQALNPWIEVETGAVALDATNADDWVRQHDLVIDGADNFRARHLLNAAALAHRVPWVYGAVHRFEGQVSVFDPRQADSPCYRCLFPTPPPPEHAPNCAEAGVLGVAPGVIGLLQATEALKLLLQAGTSLQGRLLCVDLREQRYREVRLRRDPQCPACGTPSHDVPAHTADPASCPYGV